MIVRCSVGTSAECSAAAALCDKLFGYPKDGVDVGGGIHAPSEQSRTLRYSEARAHPTVPLTFCLPIGGEVAAELVKNGGLSGSEKTELTAIDAAAVSVTFPDAAP